MLRHEQQTVRMALAAALHHSAGPKEKVEMQQNGAPRGQKTAARAREEVEHATHYGPRAQETPPPGARPGILAEPGPQRSDRSGRHSSGDNLPTLALPVLAGSASEAVDASSLLYLSAAARLDQSRQRLQQLREEQQAWDNRPSRRKEKRKKKKLPRGRFSGRTVARGVQKIGFFGR